MIYTTYFANLKNLPDNIVPISICGKCPVGYKGLQYKKLAPKYDFFMKWKQDHDNDNYIVEFQKQVLDTLNQKDVILELYKMSGMKDIALVCYEKYDENIEENDFCHRHLVSKWLSLIIEVKEWIRKELLNGNANT